MKCPTCQQEMVQGGLRPVDSRSTSMMYWLSDDVKVKWIVTVGRLVKAGAVLFRGQERLRDAFDFFNLAESEDVKTSVTHYCASCQVLVTQLSDPVKEEHLWDSP